jgi:hypothetical protein
MITSPYSETESGVPSPNIPTLHAEMRWSSACQCGPQSFLLSSFIGLLRFYIGLLELAERDLLMAVSDREDYRNLVVPHQFRKTLCAAKHGQATPARDILVFDYPAGELKTAPKEAALPRNSLRPEKP